MTESRTGRGRITVQTVMAKRVLVFGVWDLLHVGHLRFLQEAKARHNDVQLFVGVVPDELVTKGPGRPVIPTLHRVEMLEALECVDVVLVSRTADAMDMISTVRPDVYFKGADYLGPNHRYAQVLQHEKELLSTMGTETVGSLEFSTLPPPPYRTSDIISKIMEGQVG